MVTDMRLSQVSSPVPGRPPETIDGWRSAGQTCHVSTHMPAEPAHLSYAEFQRVDIRIGRVVAVDDFPEARKPAYKLRIDFGGDLGIRKSSAQATTHYSKDALLNRLVVAVVNFAPKQIGPYISEVLTLGVPDRDGGVVLLVPERDVPVGGRVF
jgi:tRNA-binding protein